MRAVRTATLFFALSLAAIACDGARPTNPYTTTAGTGGAGGAGSGGADTDPELGGPCVEDAQCDDGIDCTIDACDPTLERCRFKGDSSLCGNEIHCDGDEVCDQKLGCVPGAPASCADDNVCTIDTCVEAPQSCTHVLRDADQDGDPDIHCGGGDCDDDDPLVSSMTPEVCANGADDDCDGIVDEPDCVSPEDDTCIEPLIITTSGTYAMNSSGAAFDYPTSCATGPMGSLRDVVAAVIIPPGPPVDVVARARATLPAVSLAMAGQCGDPSSELACSGSYAHPILGQISRIRARGIGGGATETPVPLYVTTSGAGPITLDVSFEPASTKATNETCGTAAPLALGTPTEVEIVDAAEDLESACGTLLGELVYEITLTETSDLDLYAVSVDGDGWPSISLRSAACALPEDEIACAMNAAPHLFRHSLPAGDYFVAVSSTAPTNVSLTASVSPPTDPPDDEDCAGTATLTPGVTVDVPMANHQDDISLGCFGPATDAAYGLTLPTQSDVLLVQRISSGDTASIELSGPACDGPSSLLSCAFGAQSPVRTHKRGVPAGDYRVVAESSAALPQQVTAFTRPTKPATLVPFADACADAVTIPEAGGYFQGNTSNVAADFPAGCDQAGGMPNGANDQLLKLVLSQPKRVVIDMGGSSYDTMLDVRKGPACPGTEVPLACSVGYSGNKSYLDLMLDAGTYYVQVDGYNGAVGLWNLDVYVVDP